MEKRVVERFCHYVGVDTRSREFGPGEEVITPSSPGQKKLLGMILSELRSAGPLIVFSGQEPILFPRTDPAAYVLKDSSLVVRVPGVAPKPHLAFAAHVDTHPNNPGRATPMIHAYQGGDIVLPRDGVKISATALAGLEGKHIITSDGSSLLGGDDKAGVSALVELLMRLIKNGNSPVPVDVWFSVDEEVGNDNFSALPSTLIDDWDIFWTVDGDAVGTIDVETMAGGKLVVDFKGADAHPGDDGQSLRPAHYAAAEFIHRLSKLSSPWNTSQKDSFYYVSHVEEANPNFARAFVFPRSFAPKEIAWMAKVVTRNAFTAAEHFHVECTVADSGLIYTNTAPAIRAREKLLRPVVGACHKVLGHAPVFQPVRAGTDGSVMNLSRPDLPCPNLGNGARRVHSREEFVVEEELERLPDLLWEIVARSAMIFVT